MTLPRGNPIPATGVFVLAALLGIYFHYPALADRFTIHDDVRQSLGWIAMSAPDVFRDDLLARYAHFNRTPAMNGLYWLGTRFADPLLVGKVYAVLFFAGAMTAFFEVGRRLYGLTAAILAFAFFALAWQYFHFAAGGFCHALFMPLVALTVMIAGLGRWRWLPVLLPLAALISPMAAFLSGATVAVFAPMRAGRGILGRAFWQRDGVWLLLAAVISLLILLGKYGAPPDWHGELATRAEMAGRIEFTAAGRYPVLPVKSFFKEVTEERSVFLLFSLALFAVFLPLRRLVPEKELLALFAASFLCHASASLFLTRLYFPNRYVEYSFPVFAGLYLASRYQELLAWIPDRRRKLAAAALIVAISLALERPDLSPGVNTIRVDHRELYQYLAALPPDVMIAAEPHVADNIPVFARRRALVNYELAHPWATAYWREIEARTMDLFTAFFSDDPAEIRRIAAARGITHWVVRPSYFRPEERRRHRYYFEPFNGRIEKMIAGRTSFVFDSLCREAPRYRDDKYCVVATGDLPQ